ncbi:CpsD/CapB family tyrosine-protein kinase [Paucisalibacillus sp. EB02]|uniref:CpsD/CapB family tyrosine-protein kinase n=1 Tax=Paucisalibacillus sp. EB02 TaxID=1347087 RepID=UPI0005AA9E88|nr:CpsD/CapB family tyrosine-protein kinase [Paucisalibacillus sp. EB02]
MKGKRKKAERANLITIERNNTQAAEQFRSIRSNINFASVDRQLRSLVITSSSAGDGKTSTAANLAIVFNQGGKRVLLVDADMRKPKVHLIFRQANLFGLSNYLIGQKEIDEIINGTYRTDFDIITSGILPPNPAELLGSKQMMKFITTVMDRYDVVIFDTPPVLVVTDATLIANQCDGTLLVVRAKKNEVKEVKKAKEQLCFAGANLIGAVFNGKKQPKNNTDYY